MSMCRKMTEVEKAMESIMGPIMTYHEKLGFPIRPDDDVKMGTTPFGINQLQQHRDNCVALQAEVTELLDSAPWKPWRPAGYKEFDKENFKEEVVDIIFFLTALCENWDIAPHELGARLEQKLQENYGRIESGYNILK